MKKLAMTIFPQWTRVERPSIFFDEKHQRSQHSTLQMSESWSGIPPQCSAETKPSWIRIPSLETNRPRPWDGWWLRFAVGGWKKGALMVIYHGRIRWKTPTKQTTHEGNRFTKNEDWYFLGWPWNEGSFIPIRTMYRDSFPHCQTVFLSNKMKIFLVTPFLLGKHWKRTYFFLENIFHWWPFESPVFRQIALSGSKVCPGEMVWKQSEGMDGNRWTDVKRMLLLLLLLLFGSWVLSESFQRRLNFHAWISHSQPFAKKFAANSPKHLSPIEPSAKHGWMNSLNLLAGKHSMFFRKKKHISNTPPNPDVPPKAFHLNPNILHDKTEPGDDTSRKVFVWIFLWVFQRFPLCSPEIRLGFYKVSTDSLCKNMWNLGQGLVFFWWMLVSFFANPTVESKSRSGCTSSGW